MKTKNGYEIKLFADDYIKRFVKLETEWATYYAEKPSCLGTVIGLIRYAVLQFV
jgi:hypothetical protein